MTDSDGLQFLAAVERDLSVVFRGQDGAWEGHDYKVEAVAQRIGLDRYDVVVDFRDLEAAMDALFVPLHGQLLSDIGIAGPMDLAKNLFEKLAHSIPPPAKLIEVTLTDGSGKRITCKN